jgi:hypothetical protein
LPATVRIGDVAVPKVRNVIRLPVIPMAIGTKYITNSSLFILLPGVIRQPELKPNKTSKKPRIYSSSRYIAKLICCVFVPTIKYQSIFLSGYSIQPS